MARTKYWVSPHRSGWQVKREGANAASDLFELKAPAIARGRELATRNQPSELLVQNLDGTIGERSTYGQDPYPPRG